MELVDQPHGNEAQSCVLGCPDVVRDKLLLRIFYVIIKIHHTVFKFYTLRGINSGDLILSTLVIGVGGYGALRLILNVSLGRTRRSDFISCLGETSLGQIKTQTI